jgi:hypothetical protein
MSEQQHEDPIKQAASALGKRGGEAGRGAAKRRSAEHYRMAGRKSGEVRRLKKQLK